MKNALLTSLFLLGALAACGSDGKNSGDDGDDAPPADAAVDAPSAPAMIKLTGKAVSRAPGGGALANVMISGYRYSDESTAVATTTSDAMGNFTLDIATGGVALDGYLKATLATYLDTYLYPPGFIAADTTAPINMLPMNLLGTVETLTGEIIDPAKSLIALVVVNGATADSMPIADAMVTSTPAGTSVKYTRNNLPNRDATTTDATGAAFIFNTPPGSITVSATKTGTTLKSHGLKSHAGALNTTLITP